MPSSSTPMARMLGARIRKLRADANLTQEKLAYEVGASKGYVSHVEGGTRLPSLEVLDRIARRLGVGVRDLLVFPGRGPIDEAMELIRLGGLAEARRLVARAKRGSPTA